MDAFVARQPILDRQQEVYGYELLFRSGLDNFFAGDGADAASYSVVANSYLLIGIETMVGTKRAFINFTRGLIVSQCPTLLPRRSTVIEITEDVDPDEEVLAACRELKKHGYLLAMDDFVRCHHRLAPLVDMADIIKVDFALVPRDERQSLVTTLGRGGRKLLAEKVETREEFDQALQMGYSYFQGYFFGKPVIVARKDVPVFKLNYLRVLGEINRPDAEFAEVENAMKHDFALSYKLLKYVNAAAFGVRSKVASLKQALVLLGFREVRRWATLVALSRMGEDQPEELIATSVIRARLCESLAPKAGMAGRESDLFLLGLLSMLDTIVNRPMAEVMEEVPICEETRTALLGGDNALRKVYDVVLAYEAGDWEAFSQRATELGLDEAEVPELYLEAVQWANEIFGRKAGPVAVS